MSRQGSLVLNMMQNIFLKCINLKLTKGHIGGMGILASLRMALISFVFYVVFVPLSSLFVFFFFNEVSS